MLGMISQLGYVLLGILLLGILVAVHEFGHFMAARLTGIEVMEFAIGMGPRIVGWTGKKGTKFSLRCIPFGGYCAFYGEDDVSGKSKDDPRAYNRQAVWKRILTVAMGPVMNFILAFVVLVAFYWATGVTVTEPVIDSLEADRPAAVAGLLPGDRIIGVNGEDMSDATAAEIRQRIVSSGDDKALVIQRGDETIETVLTPFYEESTKLYRIGIVFQNRSVPISFGTAVRSSWESCLSLSTAILDALRALVTKGEGLEETGGPVAVVSMVSQEVADYGFEAFVTLLAFISVNLGVMNLLPIPGLDGSRLVFHIIEGIRRKPVKPEIEGTIQLVGTLLLLGLLALLTVRDVWRLF